MTYKRIVIGTDGSETAAIAQQTAVALAKEFGAEVLLTYAVDPSTTDRETAEAVLEYAVTEARRDGAQAEACAAAGTPQRCWSRRLAPRRPTSWSSATGGWGRERGDSSPGALPTRSPTCRRATS